MILHKSGYYYIGQSVDIFNRWSSHYTDLVMNKHHSPQLQKLFNESLPQSFEFHILKYISKTDIKNKSGYKGAELEKEYKRILLIEEKNYMRNYSINFSLNKDKKNFG